MNLVVVARGNRRNGNGDWVGPVSLFMRFGQENCHKLALFLARWRAYVTKEDQEGDVLTRVFEDVQWDGYPVPVKNFMDSFQTLPGQIISARQIAVNVHGLTLEHPTVSFSYMSLGSYNKGQYWASEMFPKEPFIRMPADRYQLTDSRGVSLAMVRSQK
jgi:hypothetical protein